MSKVEGHTESNPSRKSRPAAGFTVPCLRQKFGGGGRVYDEAFAGGVANDKGIRRQGCFKWNAISAH
jgi:hypothetical protein